MSLGELCEKYKKALDKRNEHERTLSEAVNSVNELHKQVVRESVESVFEMCDKELEPLTEKDKNRLKIWIAEPIHCLLFALEDSN